MKLDDALQIGHYFVGRLSPFCLPGQCEIAGGTKRGKPLVHDLEIVCEPDLFMKPRLNFGMKPSQIPAHKLSVELNDLEKHDFIFFKQGQDRNRKYWINLSKFGFPESEGFLLDLWIVLPPAQYGVQMVIRIGPNSEDNQFSKWIVTPRAKGGALPDGYLVRNGAVWRTEQIAGTNKPFPGEIPLSMPTEEMFLDFIGVTQEPADRRAVWGKYNAVTVR